MKRLLLLVGIALGAWLVGGQAAWAHATVASSDPADGSRLQQAPSKVTITFDESVQLGNGDYLRVVNQGGRRVDVGTADHPGGAGSQVSVALVAGLGDGSYTASFRVTSADSHPVAGAIRFVVGNGTLSAATTGPSAVDAGTSAAFVAVRWISFGGLAVLGGGWLALTCWPAGLDDRRGRRFIWAGWAVAVVGGVGELLMQGPYAAGTGLSTLTNGALLNGTLHTWYGTAHSIRLVLLGCLAAVLGVLFADLRTRPRLVGVAFVLGLGVAFTYAAAGHAETEHPEWLSVSSDTLHLAAMSVWIGGLVILLAVLLPRGELDEQAHVLPIFSRVAFGSVVVLAVTGTYQAWRGVGTIDALLTTTYGRLVLLKVVLFVGLLALGNLSRRAVQQRAAVLWRGVLVEIVLAAVVLGATAYLVAEPPGKAALAVVQGRPRSATVTFAAGRTAVVTVSPGRHGPVSVTIEVTGGTPRQLTATAFLPAESLGPITLPLKAGSAAEYAASGVVLPAAGTWTFTLTVRTSEFDAFTADVHIHLY